MHEDSNSLLIIKYALARSTIGPSGMDRRPSAAKRSEFRARHRSVAFVVNDDLLSLRSLPHLH